MEDNKLSYDEFLMHYRTKGSKNGVRRYQNKDGSLTPLGKIHYGVGDGSKKSENDKEVAGTNSDEKSKTSTTSKKTEDNQSKSIDDISRKNKADADAAESNARKAKAEADGKEAENKRKDDIYAEQQRVNEIKKEAGKYETASKIAKTAGDSMDAASKVNKAIANVKNRKKIAKEISEMDNKQLREKIERMSLEQQYTNLTSNRMTKGQERVQTALAVGSSVAGTAATALTIAALWKELKK